MQRRTMKVLSASMAMALALAVSACGEGADGNDDGGSGAPSGDEGVDINEELEVGADTILPLPDCPTEWSDTGGITDDEIRLGITMPLSGPQAAVGAGLEGTQAYFDWINENDPIDGKQVVLVPKDDAFDPARTVSAVQDLATTEEVFAMVSSVGTPTNLAARDVTNTECVPQIAPAAGPPQMGDPVNYPWTSSGYVPANIEARLWCQHIVDEVGEGATVAGLFQDSDTGSNYLAGVEECESEGMIELVEVTRHEATAPDITNQLTTMASSDADVALIATAGPSCSQALTVLDSMGWDPTTIVSFPCQSVSLYFRPTDPAGDGVRTLVFQYEIDDPDLDGVEQVENARAAMEAAGLDISSGANSNLPYAMTAEIMLRAAAASEEGLTRTSLMRQVWNADFEHPLLPEGSKLVSSGADDAYLMESGVMAEYDAESGQFSELGDLISLEGEAGAYEGD